jgi:hypothetical protein
MKHSASDIIVDVFCAIWVVLAVLALFYARHK